MPWERDHLLQISKLLSLVEEAVDSSDEPPHVAEESERDKLSRDYKRIFPATIIHNK